MTTDTPTKPRKLTPAQRKKKNDAETAALKAVGHPLRREILRSIDGQNRSPVQISRALDESVQLISYHMRILRDEGVVELATTTPRRGAIEHHYRKPANPGKDQRQILEAVDKFMGLLDDAG